MAPMRRSAPCKQWTDKVGRAYRYQESVRVSSTSAETASLNSVKGVRHCGIAVTVSALMNADQDVYEIE